MPLTVVGPSRGVGDGVGLGAGVGVGFGLNPRFGAAGFGASRNGVKVTVPSVKSFLKSYIV